MRTIIIMLLIAVPLAANAANKYDRQQNDDDKAAQSERRDAINDCVQMIEVLDSKPARPYAIIAPVRAQSSSSILFKKSPDKLLATLKKQGCKMNASALIDLRCQDVQVGSSNIHADAYSGHGSSSLSAVPVCQALAIRWK